MTRAAHLPEATASAERPAIAWDGTAAALGAVYAVPALVGVLYDIRAGLALAVAVLPVALVGPAPTRRARVRVAALGALTGIALLLGGLLANVPLLAVGAMAALGPATALAAARSRAGEILLNLTFPLVGIGLSYSDLDDAVSAAVLMTAGGVFAFLVLMLLPEQPASAAPAGASLRVTPTVGYGVRLGGAAATAAAIGFALDLGHVGWATGAALLVMRPPAEMQRLRSIGRVLSVIAGALVAVTFVDADPPTAVYGVAACVAVCAAAGTQRSRWYVTPAFTTFLVFLLLLHADPQTAGARFGERVGETVLGVGLAYLFGLALPAIGKRMNRRAP